MSDALQAAKKIAGESAGREPDPPCVHAEFREKRPCRGHLWLCGSEDCAQHDMTVRGSYCRGSCEDREPPEQVRKAREALEPHTSTGSRLTTPPESSRGGDKPRSDSAVSARDAELLPTLSMIFTVYNEDPDEVRATLESAAAAYPHEKLELVIIDDGGDPCSDAVNAADTGGAAIKYRRNQDNRGVGRSRNQGVRASTGKVLSFHDAHMRFPLYDEMAALANERGNELDIPEGWSSLMCLARKAATGGTIISSASCDVRKDRDFYASGAAMFWNRRDALQPLWHPVGDWDTPWKRVPCMMGAGYFMSRGTARTLAQATGGSIESARESGRSRLGAEPSQHMDGHAPPDAAGVWEDTAGKWGVSEQALSVKAYLLGIPVYAARDIYTRHYYRGKNPVEGCGQEVWKNVARCMSRLFPRGIYERRFRPYVVKRLGEDGEQQHRVEPANIAVRERCWKVFTQLVGQNAPITERHPDHEWLPRVKEAAAAVKASSGATRVLMWRPGEALFTVKQICPDADITCIVRPGPRANNWWDICRESRQTTREAGDNQSRRHSAESLDGCNPSTATGGIDIVKARLTDDYVERPLKQGWGPFDIVLINGPLQDECANITNRVLAEGGKMVRNERADRAQLCDNDREKEEKDIEAALDKRHTKAGGPSGEKRPGSAARPAPATDGSQEITVLLLNWRRTENLDEILDALAEQTIEPRVWLWDNGGAFGGDDRVDCTFSAGRNIGGMARWWIASAAETEFVCSLDDDLKPADAQVLEDMMHACMVRDNCGIVGPFGWRGRGQFMPGGSPPYKGGQHISAGEENVAVDVVKGRCMMLRRRLLRRVPMEPPLPDDADIDRSELLRRCDDIYVNIMVGRGRAERHVVPAALEGRFEDVGGQDGRALATDSGHYEIRERAIEALLRYWGNRG